MVESREGSVVLREALGMATREAGMVSIEQVLGDGQGSRARDGEDCDCDGRFGREGEGDADGDAGSRREGFGERVEGELTEQDLEDIYIRVRECERNVERSRRLREKLLRGRGEEVRFDEIDPEAGQVELENERWPRLAGSKYHCLLGRHLFVRPEALGGRVGDGSVEGLVRCRKCGGGFLEVDYLVCEVDGCGVVACRGCVRKWENERREKGKGRWRTG